MTHQGRRLTRQWRWSVEIILRQKNTPAIVRRGAGHAAQCAMPYTPGGSAIAINHFDFLDLTPDAFQRLQHAADILGIRSGLFAQVALATAVHLQPCAHVWSGL